MTIGISLPLKGLGLDVHVYKLIVPFTLGGRKKIEKRTGRKRSFGRVLLYIPVYLLLLDYLPAYLLDYPSIFWIICPSISSNICLSSRLSVHLLDYLSIHHTLPKTMSTTNADNTGSQNPVTTPPTPPPDTTDLGYSYTLFFGRVFCI